ncbi:aminotransferase class I/II-fold pyridoxal phosphate-dependent enzyme [Fusobacterium sp. SB021]|uniref:aminotransferase class I/II-fold pyridoxal phosphate-dependent enzyme n=1 Tax=Fusobacterium sp. SB021 TaxID=2744227 RepID=UPI003CF9D847
MKAIILAAGMGSRLKALTKDNPKCMVKVNGETLIERVLSQLDKCNLEEIILVLGYKKEVLKEYINNLKIKTKVSYIDNDIYDKTNNIYSLYMAKEEMLKNDILLLESDLIFDDSILKNLTADSNKNMAVIASYEPWMDGTCVKLDSENNIIDFVTSKKFDFNNTKDLYKTVNIYKFSKEFNKCYIKFLEAYLSSNGENQYYETVLETMINVLPNKLKGFGLNDNQKWYEIDDKQDLDNAESIFSSDDEKLKKLQVRYGGYWRYPKLKDFCYLVNPYFPPKKMVDELKMNFETLLTQYPSGLKVNNLLASKYFNIKEEYILVGNGAAELIKAVMNTLKDNIGFIRPTFEEYPNRYDSQKHIIFKPETEGFKYSYQDIIDYFDDKYIKTLVVINPDNPSGNYITKKGLFELLDWSVKKEINLLIDESFVDFSIEEDSTLLKDEILEKYKNLIVVKSISKSYGVPGLRLGIIVTSNFELLQNIKKEVSIWNINSFGEYYMQIYGKYEKVYRSSLDKIKSAREIFIKDLREIKELQVFDSQANYILIKILEKYSSEKLAEILINDYEIYIKDLKGKAGIDDNFIRIAVRDTEDNKYCINALKEIFERER